MRQRVQANGMQSGPYFDRVIVTRRHHHVRRHAHHVDAGAMATEQALGLATVWVPSDGLGRREDGFNIYMEKERGGYYWK